MHGPHHLRKEWPFLGQVRETLDPLPEGVDKSFLLIHLFIYSNGVNVDSNIHSLDLATQYIWLSSVKDKTVHLNTNSPGPYLLVYHNVGSSKDGEIILYDNDVTQGDHILKVCENLQGPPLASKVCLQINLSKVFAMFLLQVSSKSFGLWI